MTQGSNDAIVRDGVVITFRYYRSRRRTLGMTVKRDKSVWVRAPLGTPLGEIRDFVFRKGDWVVKVWRRIDSLPSPTGPVLGHGAPVLFQGETYRLHLEQGRQHSVSLRGDELVLRTPLDHDPERLAGIIGAWYREQAVELFGERLRLCHHRMRSEALPLPPLVIRDMKSRWGSYSFRTGRINLNLNLIKAPLPCLDYVIIHELSHIRVPNHGPRFWNLVGRYVPDHTELRRALRNSVRF